MFSSSLIKKEENPLLEVESFDAEEFIRDSGERASGGDSGHITLPIAGEAPFPRKGSPKEKGSARCEEVDEAVRDRLSILEREAYEKGFAQGQKDGLALEQRQMEEKGRQLAALFSRLEGLKGQINREAEGELLKLSLLIARKVIRQEVKTDRGIIGKTIKSASEFLADKSSIRILVNPEDMEEVRSLLPELAAMTKGGKFEVVEDNAIERGGCFLETGFGNINATIEDQLGVLERDIEQELATHREPAQ